MPQNEAQHDYSHAWLNLIMILYIGIGSVFAFIGCLGSMPDGLSVFKQLVVFMSAAVFPLLAIAAVSTAKKGYCDAVYIIYLYLAYHALTALFALDWVPVLFDMACFLYFNSSSLVEELWPPEYHNWTKRTTCLACIASTGVLMQIYQTLI